ncbi:MAG: GMC family oxidoreductase [Emcibacteraceae bacterium]|nr:GMC family oxidoreductase [Emcibacteraceae bacterium]
MADFNLEKIKDLECEVLVIGSGAGGATVANELSKNGFDVLILEEGKYMPAEKVPTNFSDSLLNMWRSGGMTLAQGKPLVSFAEGMCVGGSTEINSAIFQKPPDELISKWAEKYSIDGFSPEAHAPFYEQATRLVNASLTPGDFGAHSEILREAGEHQGWEVGALERGHKNCVGTNNCSIGCPTGAKQSMSSSVLKSFIKNNGRIVSNCRVNKLIKKSDIVEGAKAEITDLEGVVHSLIIRAKHVFVCGGATQTPTLLMRSGYKKGVGKGFKLHPTIRILAQFDQRINAHNSRHPLYAITEFSPNLRLGGSVFSLPTYGMFLTEDWQNRSYMMPSYTNMGMYYAMVRGSGVGSVASVPFSKHALVRYQLSEEDWSNIEIGLHNLSLALFENGARKIQPSIYGMKAWNSIDDMRNAIKLGLPRKKINLMSIHLFSSIGMGEDKKLNAANSYGKFHGVKNLYIADASLIPESPGVNPQATVMAFALRVTENFICKQKI